MRQEALMALYSNVVTCRGDIAYDDNDNVVTVNETDVAAKITELEAEAELSLLRELRNRKLAETDHWAYQDTPDMTTAQTNYRQSLRDITNTYSDLDTVVWPTKP